MDAERDGIDGKLEIWARELPGLDLETEGLVERIQKIGRALRRRMDETAAEFGLTNADWSMLAALRGSGPPYRLTAGRLAEQCWVSPGAMTSRIDRLEERGFVRRVPDPDDRRVLQIELLPAGSKTWDEAVAVQARKEQLVAAALDPQQKRALNELLRLLVLELEREGEPIAAPTAAAG